MLSSQALAAAATSANAEPFPGVTYTNFRDPSLPLSVHTVKVDRTSKRLAVGSTHAKHQALGLETIAQQLAGVAMDQGRVVAGINGGFYVRDRAYAGCPRGLQVVDGEVISAPNGNVTFWTDALGEPHLANVYPEFKVIQPDGSATSFGLNGPRSDSYVVLYTPAVGASTRTRDGREFVLEPVEGSRWLPLQMSREYSVRVTEIKDSGDTPVPPNGMVLSIGRAMFRRFAEVKPGSVLKLSTGCTPALAGVRTALSGAPVLVANGKRQKVRASIDAPYEESSMLERHPRTAFGWNKDWYFLVVVDGRQRDLSVGMTLDELSTYLVRLGCEEAFNLDGGGSSTLWFNGEVRNEPCDGYERPVANALMVWSRPPARGQASGGAQRATNSGGD